MAINPHFDAKEPPVQSMQRLTEIGSARQCGSCMLSGAMAGALLGSHRSCPLCGGEAIRTEFPYSTSWNAKEFRYLLCGSCGCTYVDPTPTADEFERMYARENYHDEHYAQSNVNAYAPSVEFLMRHVGSGKTLLDFGCGNGSFLAAAKAAGFECTGIEFTATAAEFARSVAHVHVGMFDEVAASSARFDVIHLGDVFEHLANQRDTMERLRPLLAPGGIFFVEGPLQSNPSLVYFVSRTAKQIRRAFGVDKQGTSAPTHLILVDRHAQRRFFTERLGCREIRFEVYENGWPYKNARPQLRSVGGLLRDGLGRAAIALSRVKFRGEPLVGNRFRALFAMQ